MNCIDIADNTEALICAIDQNAAVRPFDAVALVIAIVGVIATFSLTVVLWWLDRRRSIHARRIEVLDALFAQIDSIDPIMLANNPSTSVAFHPEFESILEFVVLALPASDEGLAATIYGEFTYALERCASYPHSSQMILLQLKGDIARLVGRWGSSKRFRARIASELIKSGAREISNDKATAVWNSLI